MPQLEEDHIHTFERSLENKEIFRCVHPLCSYYWRRVYLIGKLARCQKCDLPFTLTRDALKRKRPICVSCSNTKAARELRELKHNAMAALADMPDDLKKLILDNTLE